MEEQRRIGRYMQERLHRNAIYTRGTHGNFHSQRLATGFLETMQNMRKEKKKCQLKS